MGKEEDFERLWNNDKIKGLKFRNWIQQKVRARGYESTKENCKLYWLGKLK
ncbi:MAG: hypothetical protein QMD21_04115 [Candidatus Thermoplasmatota archaeon]|nr:hypothetical protein [Candidatus Thermoplasmatota archaeon]MDI6855951.1 hypothetical protein [Candidatus Thermoplasmatota archaeon]